MYTEGVVGSTTLTVTVLALPHSSSAVMVTVVFSEIGVPASGNCVTVRFSEEVQLSDKVTRDNVT